MSIPYTTAAPIVPSDDTDLFPAPRAIYVGTGGDIVMAPTGNIGDRPLVIFKSVPSGAVLEIAASRIMATDTTATDMVALS